MLKVGETKLALVFEDNSVEVESFKTYLMG
jgi:hypothetical protein